MNMSRRISRICCLFAVSGLLVFTVGFAQASAVSQLSGSYRVIRRTDLGSQTRVLLQLHLSNHGQSDLQIQRLTIWDSPHPAKGGSRPCSLLLHSGGSADATEELTIPRSEYLHWGHGANLRLLLTVESPGGRKATEGVRVNRISGRKAN